MDNKITDSIVLPNEGIVYLDDKAYNTLDSQSYSYDKNKGRWSYVITFSSDNNNQPKTKFEIR